MGRSIFDMTDFLNCRESYSHKKQVFLKVFVHSMPCSWGTEGMTEGPKLEFGSAAALHLHAQPQPLSRLQDEFRDHSLGGDVSHRVSVAASEGRRSAAGVGLANLKIFYAI